ncbi:MAG: electron transfer flavoprotein subunit alpha/FixB family protein, partial [Adlercreutzia sp.]|nr:electron transfer flavoprotein subunit alpha/FixB family protein [Adlercreutzia sp.]
IDVPEATPAEAFAGTVAEAVKALEPGVVLAPNAAASRVLAGAVAAQLDAAVASSVSSIAFEGDVKVVDRLVAEQRAVETLETTAPVVALVADGSDDVEATAAAPVEAVAGGAVAALTITATHAGEEGGASLASANRVLGVGRGLTSKDQLALAEALAAALDAEIACSLSLCDDYRWFEHSRVVGTSTQRIAPRLYVSVGISGQPQHMTGVRGAKTIVAINNDPEAPIFRACAYGIVGDLNKVVPALTEALS